jgi:hypothetical protein
MVQFLERVESDGRFELVKIESGYEYCDEVSEDEL